MITLWLCPLICDFTCRFIKSQFKKSCNWEYVADPGLVMDKRVTNDSCNDFGANKKVFLFDFNLEETI